MSAIKFYAVLIKVPGPQICNELSHLYAYIRVELTRNKKDAIKRADERIDAVAVEEIGGGIVWVREAI